MADSFAAPRDYRHHRSACEVKNRSEIALQGEIPIKGPGLRIDIEIRRVWRCPKCPRELKTSARVSSQKCRCSGEDVWMTLVEEPQPALRPAIREVIDSILSPKPQEDLPAEAKQATTGQSAFSKPKESRKKKKRRGGRRNRGKRKNEGEENQAPTAEEGSQPASAESESSRQDSSPVQDNQQPQDVNQQTAQSAPSQPTEKPPQQPQTAPENSTASTAPPPASENKPSTPSPTQQESKPTSPPPESKPSSPPPSAPPSDFGAGID